MSTVAKVAKLPTCDVCGDGETLAKYDGKTIMGPWAMMCPEHFKVYGLGLGLGVGQKLEVEV